MKTVRDIIRRPPVWVNPGHTVDSAVILMRGHGIGALPVLEGHELVGIVSYSQVLGAEPFQRIGEVMTTNVPVLSPETSVRDAAQEMARSRMSRLPVLENGRLVGFVTCGDLLEEVGRSYDPLTGLSWADSLREWAIEQLQSGQEITVLFLDLDRFGHFNKLYGHLVGDEVLRRVASTLLSVLDPDVEFLSRYGGDEFCIATLRTAAEAEELAGRISRRIGEIEIPDLHEERITCTIGQYGGKRTREREHVHYAATLNSLINLASRDCMAKKAARMEELPQAGEEAPLVAGPRLRLSWVDVEWKGRKANVRVDLQLQARAGAVRIKGGAVVAGRPVRFPATASVETDESGVLTVVAQTTAAALKRALPAGHDIQLAEVILSPTADQRGVVTVTGEFISPPGQFPIAGSAVVGGDPYRAAAAAVLAATNRLVGRVLESSSS